MRICMCYNLQMNEFTAQPGYQSAPLNGGEKKDDSVKWVSEGK